MKKNFIFLVILVALCLGIGYVLHAYYGDSYPFPPSEDSWMPDGNGGWTQHGHPSAPMPVGESVVPPLITYYLPFLIPGILLILFMFTPLGKILEDKKKVVEEEVDKSKIEE